jgi:hypothetical protein
VIQSFEDLPAAWGFCGQFGHGTRLSGLDVRLELAIPMIGVELSEASTKCRKLIGRKP